MAIRILLRRTPAGNYQFSPDGTSIRFLQPENSLNSSVSYYYVLPCLGRWRDGLITRAERVGISTTAGRDGAILKLMAERYRERAEEVPVGFSRLHSIRGQARGRSREEPAKSRVIVEHLPYLAGSCRSSHAKPRSANARSYDSRSRFARCIAWQHDEMQQ